MAEAYQRKQTDPVTLTIDMKDHVVKSLEALEELQARLEEFAPGATRGFSKVLKDTLGKNRMILSKYLA